MNAAIRKEPEHESAWGWHHVWILFGRLFSLLCMGKVWSIVAWNLLLQSLAMRRRNELCGLFETNGFGNIG